MRQAGRAGTEAGQGEQAGKPHPPPTSQHDDWLSVGSQPILPVATHCTHVPDCVGSGREQ